MRVTNGIPEIIVKIGEWSGTEQRKELSFFGKQGEFDTLVEIFAALGFRKGMMCERKSKVYEYKGIEFALVEVPRLHLGSMLQPAFSDNLPDSARRNEEGVLDILRPSCNEAEWENSENPSGYGKFPPAVCRCGLDVSQGIHFHPCSFCRKKFASIAGEDTFEVKPHSYYYEAEKMADAGEDGDKITEEIKKVCEELGLGMFDKKSFFEYIHKLNDEVNEIFDYSDYTQGYFKKRFGV